MKNLIPIKLLGASTASLLILTGFSLPAQAVSIPTETTQVATTLGVNEDAAKAELLTRINAYRAENGLAPVRLRSELGTVAQAWSDKTALAGGFKHNPDFSTQIPQGWLYASEIIAASYDPEEIVFGWKVSPGHNAVMLAPEATEIGFGYTYQGNPAGEYYGTYYATAIFADYPKSPPVPPVKTSVTPQPPVWNQTTYEIPSITGVQYKVNGVPASAGIYLGKEMTVVTAEAKEGYIISGTSSWSKDYEIVIVDPSPSAEIVTPIAPTFNATQYIIPNTKGIQYKANDVIKNAGIYAGTGTVTITATALPGYALNGTSSWANTFIPVTPPAPVVNPSIKSQGDVVAIDSAGKLWNYGNLKNARIQIGSGWQVFTDIHLTDWNQDGYTDIIAKHSNGNLYLYKALAVGGFSTVQIGSGWQNYSIDVTKWDKQAKYPSIVATNTANGNLYHYANTKGTGIDRTIQIGSGWQGLDINMVDWDKDGNIDIVAKNRNGQILLYRTNGIGRFLNEKRAIIGGGWNIFNSLTVVRDMGGSGTSGLLGRNAITGNLVYYQANKSSWGGAKVVGYGWNGYKIANQ